MARTAWIGQVQRLADVRCPVCLTVLNRSMGVALDDGGFPAAPEPGNILICGTCVSVLVFEATDRLRVARNEDIEAMDTDAQQLISHFVAHPPHAARRGGLRR